MLSTIHYMFSDKQGNQLLFDSMDSLLAFLGRLTSKHLLLEFVDPSDRYASELVSDRLLRSGEYSLDSFKEAVGTEFSSLELLGTTHRQTRTLWLASREMAGTRRAEP